VDTTTSHTEYIVDPRKNSTHLVMADPTNKTTQNQKYG